MVNSEIPTQRDAVNNDKSATDFLTIMIEAGVLQQEPDGTLTLTEAAMRIIPLCGENTHG